MIHVRIQENQLIRGGTNHKNHDIGQPARAYSVSRIEMNAHLMDLIKPEMRWGHSKFFSGSPVAALDQQVRRRKGNCFVSERRE